MGGPFSRERPNGEVAGNVFLRKVIAWEMCNFVEFLKKKQPTLKDTRRLVFVLSHSVNICWKSDSQNNVETQPYQTAESF